MDEINVSVLVVFVFIFCGKCEKCHGNQTIGGKWKDAVLSKEQKRCAQSLLRLPNGEPKMRTYTYTVVTVCDSDSLYASYAYACVCERRRALTV